MAEGSKVKDTVMFPLYLEPRHGSREVGRRTAANRPRLQPTVRRASPAPGPGQPPSPGEVGVADDGQAVGGHK
jgi:hypothetical protein